jgi:hypothetical protein
MNTLYSEAKPQERTEVVREYKLALTAYLEKRLTPFKERGDGVVTATVGSAKKVS